MAVSDSFLEFVLEQLDGLSAVTARRMFGGVGLYAGETFFGLIADDTLYFKVDDASVAAYVAAGTGPFRPYPDQPDAVMKGYYGVPASVLEDRDELVTWARRAVAAGSKPRRRKGRRR